MGYRHFNTLNIRFYWMVSNCVCCSHFQCDIRVWHQYPCRRHRLCRKFTSVVRSSVSGMSCKCMISYRDVLAIMNHGLRCYSSDCASLFIPSCSRIGYATLSNLHRRKTGFSFQMKVFERNANDIAPASTLYTCRFVRVLFLSRCCISCHCSLLQSVQD